MGKTGSEAPQVAAALMLLALAHHAHAGPLGSAAQPRAKSEELLSIVTDELIGYEKPANSWQGSPPVPGGEREQRRQRR